MSQGDDIAVLSLIDWERTTIQERKKNVGNQKVQSTNKNKAFVA
jgi:hypothetical protein